MPATAFEIRVCTACGLRYPLMEGHAFGARCPACMGATRRLLSRNLNLEPNPLRPVSSSPTPRNRAYAVLLDNIRSAWNVGSVLRSADGFGFAHAYLCGITPTPDNEAVAKTSLGAEDTVSWSYHKDAVKLVLGLKKQGWRIWALEETDGAQTIASAALGEADSQIVLILGNEVTGVDPGLLAPCEKIFCIPMRGEKKSFNVAMAFSIAAYQLEQRIETEGAGVRGAGRRHTKNK